MINYREFRLNKLSTPEFSHLWLLLFWPIYGIAFQLLERCMKADFTPIWCAWDDMIPFCEWFVIPYYLWFVYLAGMVLYGVLFDLKTFRTYMQFIILTYSITLIIYLIFPNSQELRPVEFARDNWMVDVVRGLYAFDTNTNVCPSLHVIGSTAVLLASWKSIHFRKPAWRIFFLITTTLISVSTVMLKQHSVIDIFVGYLVCAVAYPFVYCGNVRKWIGNHLVTSKIKRNESV